MERCVGDQNGVGRGRADKERAQDGALELLRHLRGRVVHEHLVRVRARVRVRVRGRGRGRVGVRVRVRDRIRIGVGVRVVHEHPTLGGGLEHLGRGRG